MREKIVIVGAGSAMFTQGLVADLIERRWDSELCLVDIDSDALDAVKKLVGKMIVAKNAPVQLTASTDSCKVLHDATAVISTIAVGGRRAWEKDVVIPRKYGIYQPVGDSVLPGGASRALRMIPVMVQIARDVEQLAPKALFFNYANPMGPICRGVRKATGINMVGLCHGVNHVGNYLAKHIGLNKIEYNAVGVNHLTWFTDVFADGKDLMPALKKVAKGILSQKLYEKKLCAHFAENGTTNKQRFDEDLNPFSWELLCLFGAIPSALDRHVAEFFPSVFKSEKSYYGRTLGVDAYSFEQCISYGDRLYSEMCRDARSEKPLAQEYFDRFSGEHEQVLEIIDSIRNNRGTIYSANLPNTGQVSNLPTDSILEAPAVADSFGLRALQQKPLSWGIAGILSKHLGWVETIVEAALTGSRQAFIQALLLEGSVSSVDCAVKLAEELLAEHIEYLPQFQK
jgi:alpha-galactosidase